MSWAFCTACEETFKSDTGFDRHRVGKHAYTITEGLRRGLEDGRRCLAAWELEEAKWEKDSKGRWFPPRGTKEKPSPGRDDRFLRARKPSDD